MKDNKKPELKKVNMTGINLEDLHKINGAMSIDAILEETTFGRCRGRCGRSSCRALTGGAM